MAATNQSLAWTIVVRVGGVSWCDADGKCVQCTALGAKGHPADACMVGLAVHGP